MDIYCLTVLEFESLKSRYWQDWLIFFFRVMREVPVPGLSPWLADSHLLLVPLHIIFHMCVSVQIFPIPKDINYIGLGARLIRYDHILTDYIYKDPISKYVYILRYWGR